MSPAASPAPSSKNSSLASSEKFPPAALEPAPANDSPARSLAESVFIAENSVIRAHGLLYALKDKLNAAWRSGRRRRAQRDRVWLQDTVDQVATELAQEFHGLKQRLAAEAPRPPAPAGADARERAVVAVLEMEDAVDRATCVMDMLVCKARDEDRKGRVHYEEPAWLSHLSLVACHTNSDLKATFERSLARAKA
jgi:hypothetical protein